jgi:prophage tail gpP-like protein
MSEFPVNQSTGTSSSPSSAVQPGGGQPDGELLIKTGGQIFASWIAVSVTLGVERMPSSFSIEATIKTPGDLRPVIPINSATQLLIGGHVVVTGYVEKIVNQISPGSHTLTLEGRGRCCDLVDCSALLPGASITGASIGSLAKQLVKPFAGPIAVVMPNGDGDKKDYIFNITLGETPYELLERVGRYEGLIPYENADGNLVLARAGTAKHASGFTEGQNVQEISFTQSVNERYSTYIPQIMSADTLSQLGANGNAAGAPASDPGITRYRDKVIVSEQMTNGAFLAEQRAAFEALQRIGRAFVVELVCDSWLDSAGMPWTPNQLVPVSMPSIGLNVPDLVIISVNFLRNGQTGTTARLTLMDKRALTIEPSALQGINAQFNPAANSQTPGPLGTPVPTVAPLSAQNAGDNRNVRAGEGPGL